MISQRKAILIGMALILFNVFFASMIWRLAPLALQYQLLAIAGTVCAEIILLVGFFLIKK